MADSWIDAEPGLARVAFELRCIGRRARRLWPVSLGIAILAAAIVLPWHARKGRLFESSVVLSVTEIDVDNSQAPIAGTQLKRFLFDVILNNSALLRLMREHHYMTSSIKAEPSRALENMRDNIGLSVIDSYRTFLGDQQTRSQKVIVRFRCPDPDLALRLARALSNLIVEGQANARQTASEEALRVASLASNRTGEDLLAAQAELSRLRREYLEAPPERRASLLTPLRSALSSVNTLDQQMQLIHTRATRIEFDSASAAAGLKYEVLDPGHLDTPPTLTRQEEAILLAIFSFFFTIPVAGLMVGTFDWKVRDLDGCKQLGVKPFGRITRFAGCDFGSLRRRRAEGKRLA